MAKPWFVDPSWDPMQDLENCKEALSLMAPAVKNHSEVIGELINQNNNLADIVQQDRLEIALLTAEVIRLRKQIEKQD